MNELRKFYVRTMGGVAVAIFLIALSMPKFGIPWLQRALGNDHWLVWVITQRWFIVAILFGVELFIRKCLWRIVHPELDFSGKWRGYTKYLHARIGNAPVPFGFGQEVRIKQDCLSIQLEPSKGFDFTFKSRAIDIHEKEAKLVYAYHVRYSGESTYPRPDEAYGYEELEVVGDRKRGRPQQLEGWFAHCAIGKEPVYAGEVHLFREGYEPEDWAEKMASEVDA